MYLAFTDPITDLGHTVEHFDHAEMRSRFGLAGCGERFAEKVKSGSYDVVIYQTSGQDWMEREAIREAARYTRVVAFNSDDDWQWESYTKALLPYFTFMVTTYPAIYAANKGQFPTLLLSQWGCYDRFGRTNEQKDLDFTFAGMLYGNRLSACRQLRTAAKLRTFGPGSGLANLGLPYFRGAGRIPWLYGKALHFEGINDVWNRTRVSYTPLGASVDDGLLQIKSRVFEMGLSESLMLCERSPLLDQYYTDGREYVSFQGLDDCAEKARYYLANEAERERIAGAYRDRTRKEHLWQHRFGELFKAIA
jgi:hypothetical protein